MKIALTGHTKGLGKEIHNAFNCDLVFSRSNGYDISKKEDRTKIIQESMNSDVFINNAYDAFNQEYGFSQTQLLYELYQAGFKGLTVNVAASIETVIRRKIWKYDIHKRALIDASKQLYYSGHKSCVISPGTMDCGLGDMVDSHKKLDVSIVLDSIRFIIDGDAQVQHIILTPRHK